ncbi:hypothetical protein [Acidisarcina polymorpha]|uniref:hypothetical protein n=1 Tax=Acidisarcina polymorpha TaxID=2211140 RepID=UPI000DEEE2D9|nr:hypothetical protein [Acidisarcina polymorpha]
MVRFGFEGCAPHALEILQREAEFGEDILIGNGFSPRPNEERASAISRASLSETGSSSYGALASAMETGSSIASSRPTTAETWRVDMRSISS